MISKEEKQRLKRHINVYSPLPTKLIIDEHQQCYTHINHHQASITIGSQTPYLYQSHFHQEGYLLFIEGLNFHEIASLLYTDYHLFQHIYNEALTKEKAASQAGKSFYNKQITYKQCKDIIQEYVISTNLPLILKAIEDGAIENAMGQEHPETWNALMYARQTIIKSFLKKDHQNDTFLMDKLIQEIMAICTYGYRFSLKNSIYYLPKHLPNQFQDIKKLAITGRLLTKSTQERLSIAKQILELCLPIIQITVKEILQTINTTSTFSNLPNSLFSSAKSEIAIQFQNSSSDEYTPQETKPKYNLDLSDEDFQRIEQLENQQEKQQQYEFFQEIHKREQETQKQKEKSLQKQIDNTQELDNKIMHTSLQRTTPTKYGAIALRSQQESIIQSNKLARLLKRERMYASKNIVKRKKEYGRQLDQQNLYRATIDGRIFKEYKEGKKKDLCVYILVDTSESMSGEKIINTMKGCFQLARVLQTLHIPFRISAHKSLGNSSIQMTEVVSFKECHKRQVLKNIYSMHVSGGTREDIALEYVLRELAKYKRQKKGFVFVLSDGDTQGVKRIHELTHLYKKEHDIDVIGIGIQTAPLITRTYPQGLFIEDIQSLPDVLIKKLREIAL